MSLFKRPAWAKQQLSDNEDEERSETNIFSHSHSYGDIVAEQERRKREKAEKKKAKAERRSSGKRDIKDEPNADGTPKRRRITLEESEKLLGSVGLPSRLERSDDEEEQIVTEESPVRRSPRKAKLDSDAVKPPRRAEVIDLGESSDEVEDGDINAARGGSRTIFKPPAPADEVQDDSDDEFAELARKARQQRQQRTNNRSSNTPGGGAASPSPGLVPAPRTNHDRPDPTIQLLVTSPLPNTNPLIVHRKLSQPTAAIRLAWCQKQNFSPQFAESVFFIHRMRRVYDVTTCRSLGLDVDEYGNVRMMGAEGREGVEKVHLEAVTEEVFGQMKEAKRREAQVRSGELPPEGEQEGGEGGSAAPEKQESLIRIVLRAKGMEDLKLKVKPSTTIAKIASAYNKQRLGDDCSKTVNVEFDGDSLSPEDLVGDTEIEDMMVVEVHVS